ncbi:MAG: GDP-mannose 4,6-dehydratase [Candidatus Hodarchaeales archaeon]|jgi:GDPmannose 4,6-dehydratase
MDRIAFITGITGQDGSYLAEFLLEKGYTVHGMIRRTSTFNTQRIKHIFEEPFKSERQLILHYGDLTDSSSISSLITEISPDEVYHLAAQSHVKVSFELPKYTGEATGIATTSLLEAIRKSVSDCKFYQASSSEMFGSSPPPQNEKTPFHPRSPYAAAKVYAFWMAVNYREAYSLFTSNGILFNHESPRRGKTFVTRKITQALANIRIGKQKYLYLGNLDAKRDWGYAPEYVSVMWEILQQSKPEDYVIGTGETHSIKEFLEEAFLYLDMDWTNYVKVDPRYIRPTDVEVLRADVSKAAKQLNWHPKVRFSQLVRIMVDYDLLALGIEPPGEGINFLEKEKMVWTNNIETKG